MRSERLLNESLQELAASGLLREPDDGLARVQVTAAATRLGLPLLDASSNDYLGLAGCSVSRETVVKAGTAASRLIHGTSEEHLILEAELATWVGAETALLFSSTYAANLGLISAIGVRGSLIVSDATNHASLIDGARLARAEVAIVPHLDLDALRSALRRGRDASACWLVTESYFSMDGDGPDLRALRALCDEHDASLVVDEAHSLGVFGPSGAGRCKEAGIRPDILVGALGKAVGTHGGFVAGSASLRTYLWNRARSFIFSTAPSPQHADLTTRQLEAVRGANGLRERLEANGAWLRSTLKSASLAVAPGTFGPIVSVIVGSNSRALAVAERLRAVGILAQAIRSPTVPVGSERIRLTVKATFRDEDMQRLTRAVVEACRES
ncbi:MAG TPA: 8-amino-7-oxononanoate synthase [Polyangiaceae bacterium]|nr:8-amino-7-oxononanoate synthase [Polyangiaceae bacterium]